LNAWKGHGYPLGATWTGEGVNFALFSQHATGVELCLFNALGEPEAQRIRLRERSDYVWHCFVPELLPGQLYAYRIEGPYDPPAGHRFNANKLVLDPYAKAIAGKVQWGDEMFGYTIGHPDADLSFDTRDNATVMPKGIVIDPTFQWSDHQRPNRPLHDNVIYEVHVKGFSRLWEDIPEGLRGTYAGLATPEAIRYFKRLGVTTLELMPVHAHADSKHLVDRGLTDYWGYNTLGFFAPEAKYSSTGDMGAQVQEFKTMVNKLHRAGLEVILDVVYNHTAEGNHLGPMLSFKGIDNANYYRLTADSGRYYMDYTGTGNTLNVPQPRVLQLVMNSLRYWVNEMHVDGFRFDLAPALARELHEVSKLSSFFDVIQQDPVLSRIKLIAEPWDVGEGGYQVGNFPALWAEWNGRYRDAIRRYWKGEHGQMRDLAYRLCGSADLYEGNNKTPNASINFITSHDGYTLQDLVAFEQRHNEANGEENRDGDQNNNSCNWGHEGLDAPPRIRKLRRRLVRNFLATLFVSQGVPMLRAGDEHGATQRGNNNAYCQDNELSWLDWNLEKHRNRLFRFASRLIHYRKAHPILRQPQFFRGRDLRGTGIKDITWINADGTEMTDQVWAEDYVKVLGVMLSGDSTDLRDFQQQPILDDTLLLFFNAAGEDVDIILPGREPVAWRQIIDTTHENGFLETIPVSSAGVRQRLKAHSFVLFEQDRGSDEEARDLQASRETAQSGTRAIPVVSSPEGSGIISENGTTPERAPPQDD
jgi:isoamylase